MSLPNRLRSQVLGSVLPRSDRAVARCVVCGSREVTTDEVADRGERFLLLAECPHCDHRWTQSTSLPTLPARPARVAREVADAA